MDSGDEDEATVGGREYNKMRQSLLKAGYRDGAIEGKRKAIQREFDTAYKLSYNYCLKIGELQGVIEATIIFQPETKDTLQPLLTKIEEYRTMLMSTDYPLDEQKKNQVEQNWSLKLTDFKEEFGDLYPAGASLILNLIA